MATKEASSKITGYIFQFERALYRLFSSEAAATTLGIETDDDVVEIVTNEDGEVLITFEQDKSTIQADGHPYQDSSKNLWHTLHIWLEALPTVKSKNGNVTYCLVTNKNVPASAFAKSLEAAADEQATDACIVDLKQRAGSAQGGVATTMKAVAAFSEDDLRFVIQRVRLMDEFGTASGATPKNATIQLFQLPGDLTEKGPEIYRSILGFVVDTCVEGWRKKQPVWIAKEGVAARLHTEIAAHRMARYVDKPLFSTRYKEYLSADGNAQFFLSQLQQLEANAAMCDRALSHYWGFYSERVRLQAEGDVLPTAWQARDELLHERWAVIRENVLLQASGDTSQETIAKKILATTIDGTYTAPLGLQETQNPYFTSGNYHDLANQKEQPHFVYWHEKFAPTKDSGKKK